MFICVGVLFREQPAGPNLQGAIFLNVQQGCHVLETVSVLSDRSRIRVANSSLLKREKVRHSDRVRNLHHSSEYSSAN